MPETEEQEDELYHMGKLVLEPKATSVTMSCTIAHLRILLETNSCPTTVLIHWLLLVTICLQRLLEIVGEWRPAKHSALSKAVNTTTERSLPQYWTILLSIGKEPLSYVATYLVTSTLVVTGSWCFDKASERFSFESMSHSQRYNLFGIVTFYYTAYISEGSSPRRLYNLLGRGCY